MHKIGEKILEKLNERADATGRYINSMQPIQTQLAFAKLHEAYDFCYSIVEDILAEIEDESGSGA